MRTCNYQFRVSGLREDQGQIRAKSLVRVIDGLLRSAERVTNLLATGSGSRRGGIPAWLDATVDFMVTGQRPGSTILDIEAPKIGDTAGVLLTQQEMWPRRPAVEPEDTALDLVSRAIAEVSPGMEWIDRPAKPMDLSDTWPGDEPIEELLAQLD